jgi:hypothetical protein
LTVIQNDIQNLHAVKEAMTGADIVFHLASNPDISKAATQPDIDFWQGTDWASIRFRDHDCLSRLNQTWRLVFVWPSSPSTR